MGGPPMGNGLKRFQVNLVIIFFNHYYFFAVVLKKMNIRMNAKASRKKLNSFRSPTKRCMFFCQQYETQHFPYHQPNFF